MKNLTKKFYIIFSDMGRLPPKLYKTQRTVLKQQQNNPQYKYKEFESESMANSQLQFFKLEHQRFMINQKKKKLQEDSKEKIKVFDKENTNTTLQNSTNDKSIITGVNNSHSQKLQQNPKPNSKTNTLKPNQIKIRSLQDLNKEREQLYGLTPNIQKLLYYHTPTQSSYPINPDALYSGYFDGCTKFNPGPSGAGYFIRQQKKTILEASCPLGTKTNNQSQFLALLYLLTDAYVNGIRYLNVYGDSKLAIEITNRKMTASNINIIHYAQANMFIESIIPKPISCQIKVSEKSQKMVKIKELDDFDQGKDVIVQRIINIFRNSSPGSKESKNSISY